ncbi:MAG TPA: tRNA (adenosine(37)-N6)-threonylcarbamoyltransferase complex transferase subunit TsaD [Vicinamibacterales bacterium]|jgi:N6-L-threonylcarbamoyladenine synthase|nr:tRNA (adenosine(37)-N6)-threonylcarbamoyltransferase complex transferase subunit TsaD [Vicinamibacterales bacterium]
MRILGIETSCDETSAAVVEETGDAARPWATRANIIASQIPIHREWGGVVPELASRQHIRDICGVVERALTEADATWSDLGAVAVTQGPGLVGSLLVGISFAKAAAAAANLPLVAVHHLAGHIESLVLENGELPLPAVVLVVSGGHTSLYLIERPGAYRLLSRTRDDAAGEAYDKVAKLLGLGYPGGPIIDRLAKVGNDRAVALPTTRLTHADRNAPELRGDLDFSFSGLKTAVLRYVRAREMAISANEKDSRPLFTDSEIADVAASFQRVVVSVLIERLFTAARRFGARSVGIAGGVSANSRLRAELQDYGRKREMPTFLPSLRLSTDNAAMIAAAGLRKFRAGAIASFDINADAALPL